MSTVDSRKTPRVAVPNVMVRISTAERFRSAYLRDLSEGGLFIKADKPLPIGREVVVDLLPPGFTAPLRLAATVVRHGVPGSPGMGVKFKELTPEVREALHTLVHSYDGNAVPANLLADPKTDPTRRLEALLEQYALLKTALEAREKELAGERERHREAEVRALNLAADVEALKTHSGKAPSSSQAAELRAELNDKDAVLSETRMRISELEGNLEAYRSEVEALEEDDATSRRLAATLAQEKMHLTKALERANVELREERETGASRLKELEGRLEHTDAATQEIIAMLQLELEKRQQLVNQHSSRASALEAQVAEQGPRNANFDAEMRALRLENASLKSRLEESDQSEKEALAKVEKLRVKERELRKLLAALSAPSEDAEDEVVVDETDDDDDVEVELSSDFGPVAPAVSAVEPVPVREKSAPPEKSPPPKKTEKSAQPEKSPPPKKVEKSSPPEKSPAPKKAAAPEPDDWSLPPEESPLPLPVEERLPAKDLFDDRMPDEMEVSGFPAPVAEAAAKHDPAWLSEPQSEDVELSIEFSAPVVEAPPPMARADFEKRVRANDELIKTGRFDDHQPSDDNETKAKGLLEAGGRFSELMVLGRGVLTPPQLLEVLFSLHCAGAISFR